MTDADYFHRREQQERARAAASTDAAVRAVHLELANNYAMLRRGPNVRQSPPSLRLVGIFP